MNKLKTIFIFTILFLISNVKSIDPPSDQYDCLSRLITKFTMPWINGLNGTGHYDVCAYGGYCDGYGNIKYVILYPGSASYNKEVLDTDISCFTKLQQLELHRVLISSGALYYPHPNLLSLQIYETTTGLSGGITQQFPRIGEIMIRSNELNGTTLKLSDIGAVGKFTNLLSYVKVEPDAAADKTRTGTLSFSALGYPDLTGFDSLELISFYFPVNFNLSSIPNFATISDVSGQSSISITHVGPSVPFYLHLNSKITSIYLNAVLQRPSSFINWPNPQQVFKFFAIQYYGDSFVNEDGTLPFEIPNSGYVGITIGNLSVVPSYMNHSPLSVYDFKQINAKVLPVYTGSSSSYDLANNQLAGTIDPSWCTTEIYVENNLLTGEIPSCYSCYFNFDHYGRSFFWRFSNNLFTNFDQNLPCTTFRPRLTLIDDGLFKNLLLTGNDIGFNPTTWVINGSIGLNNIIVNTNGKNYTATLQYSTFKDVDYFKATFTQPYDVTFTFPTKVKQPIIHNVSISGNQLTIQGLYFSSYIDYVDQNIQVDGIECDITVSQFGFIQCTLQSPLNTNEKNILELTVDQESVQIKIDSSIPVNNLLCTDQNCNSHGICVLSVGVCECSGPYQGDSCGSPIILCAPTCAGNCNNMTGECVCSSNQQGEDCTIPLVNCISGCAGTCKNQTGECICSLNQQGADCATPFIGCVSGCVGTCKNVTGECLCSSNQQGIDCATPFFNCSASCKGNCNNLIGECVCSNDFYGKDCDYPREHVSSVEPAKTTGGEVIFNGKFGDVHTDLTITIGGVDCPLTSVTASKIRCTAAPGTGSQTINITQNGVSYTKSNLYVYANTVEKCQNDCSDNGRCNAHGVCECATGFTLYDCSLPINDENKEKLPSIKSTVYENGKIGINSQEINFQIYFKSLIEIDFNGNPVKTYDLVNNWVAKETFDNTYTHIQSLDNGCSIVSKIQEIIDPQGKEFTFANTQFKLDNGQIKFGISIQNYVYQNNLNTLKLELLSSVDNQTEIDQDNGCNEKDTQVEIDNQVDSRFNYIKISKNNKILNGRFINKVISDGYPTFLSTSISNDVADSVVVSYNLPHCIESCDIDPDFSVLLHPDFEVSCDQDSSRKWVIPVAVVIPVAGVALIAAGILAYKKRKSDNELISRLSGRSR